MEPRRIALLVNPSAGGGRALKALPRVEAELTRLGLASPACSARSRSATRESSRVAAVDAGEVPVPLSGDGLVGAVAGALRDRPGAVMGVLPGGRGNDFARVCGIPRDPVAACAILATGVARPIDLGEVVSDGSTDGGQAFVGIASLGFDSEANRIANEAPAFLGPLVYAYAAHPGDGHLAAGDLRRHRRPRAPDLPGLDGRGGQREGLRWRHVHRPRRRARRRHAGRRDGLPALAPALRRWAARRSSRARTSGATGSPSCAAREVRVAADRPFTVYADGDPIGELPVTVRAIRRSRSLRRMRPSGPRLPVMRRRMSLLGAKLAAARAAGAVSRRAGRGGTSLPGKLLLRLEPDAVGELRGG